MIGFYTIAQGETVAVWDKSGGRTIVQGPRRVSLWSRRVEQLTPHVAGPTQYLIVEHRDGRIVHQRGPVVVWQDPAEHLKIRVSEAIILDANQAMVVYRQEQGKVERRIVNGPELFVPEPNERVEKLKTHIVGPSQYLVVEYRDGRIVHQRGPAVMWLDPAEHLKITVADAIPLDANEAVVVYRQEQGKVQRRIVRGPELFVPDSNEWLHEFRWHGADPKDPTRKIPRALNFSKIRVIPDQMYFDVESVRTSDDALLVVRLMIFFELIDIALMLDQTHDPIADFINAVTADVIDFTAKLTFEQFKEQTEKLSCRETYQQLAQRSGRIGYRINKVVYRGYAATAKLQAMHDNAIEMRTRLKLDAETETQAQEIADMKLGREQERARQKQEMEKSEMEHQNRMKQIAHEEQLRREQTDHEARLRREHDGENQILEGLKNRGEIKLREKETAYNQRVNYLKSVRGLEVDVTRYLVARHERPDRRIRIDGDREAQLHLHEAADGG